MKTRRTSRVLFLLLAISFSAGSYAASEMAEYAVDHEFSIHSESQLIFVPRKTENGEKEKEGKKEASEEENAEAKKEVSVVKAAPSLMLDAVSGATVPLKEAEERKHFSEVIAPKKSPNSEELFWLRKKARPDVEFSPFPMVM